MTRQVALAAIIAFGVTVLVLSVWQPKADSPPTPTPGARPSPVVIERAAEVRVDQREFAEIRERPGRPLPARVRAALDSEADAGPTP
jgi:hypothetical protein